ncbi:uncharacterized protein LOC119284233 [Triticum dicoccoides]|uniref:uncharacterized protein LOC119284233 n=1 Tax=Triticum dicoccoides TaxID=85692 RepID=UPI00188EFFDB|nr:uncharacterized protein LOC119284233 [Triticum dicoccoides]
MSNSDLEADPVAPSTQEGQRGENSANVVVDLTLYEFKEQLLLLSTLVSTVTYVAGLNLPGGSWEQDDPGRHIAGDPILPDIHYSRYLAFYYCNATAFTASLVVSLILVILQKKSHVMTSVLRVVMMLNLLSLMGSYGAGSCRDAFTTIYTVVTFSVLVFCIICVFLSYSYLWRYGGNEAHSNSNSNPYSNHDFIPNVREHILFPQAKLKDKENIDALILLATFAITITYVSGLSPPGGFWTSTQDGHHLSEPVLQASGRFRAFFVCNTTSFVVSLLIIVFLLEKMMLGEKLKRPIQMRLAAPYGLIAVTLLGLMGAYAAGSCRADGNTVLVLAIPVCTLLLLAFVSLVWYFNLIYHTINWLKARFKDWFGTPSHRGTRTYASQYLKNTYSLDTLLAILVVSITYQAGLDPPGGIWQEDRDGHKMGHPVLQTTHPTRYKVFFYSNSIAFVTSLIVILMIKRKFSLNRRKLEAALVLDLFCLIMAYGAGSARDVKTSVYMVALAGLILVYIIAHITIIDRKPEPANDSTVRDLEDERKMLLLIAILATTLTYQAGLTPPGGFWSANDQGLGRRAGFSVVRDNYPQRYNTFVYCNAASFMASVSLILLLINPNLYMPGIRSYALYVCMLVGMFGLMGAYATGTSQHLKTSILVLTLVVPVLAFIALLVPLFWFFSKVSHGSSSNTTTTISTSTTTTTTNNNNNQEEGSLEYLILLGILGASMTYQAGLKPPGGLWQDNIHGHYAGNPILHDIDKHRYNAFFYSNSTSIMASVVVVAMLLPLKITRMFYGRKLPLWPVHTIILLDMFCLLVAYATGSTR